MGGAGAAVGVGVLALDALECLLWGEVIAQDEALDLAVCGAEDGDGGVQVEVELGFKEEGCVDEGACVGA